MSTRFTASQNLQLTKAPKLDAMQLKANTPIEDRLEFTPISEGQHYVNVFVETEVNGNKLMRAFAIPVAVGDIKPQAKQKPKLDADGNPVVELPAEQH
jgi:hypothetical protein